MKVWQKYEGNFRSHAKYANYLIKKFKMIDSKICGTPMDLGMKLTRDGNGKVVSPTLYRKLLGIIIYMTISRPSIFFCSWRKMSKYRVETKESREKTKKTIMRHVKGTLSWRLEFFQ
jgi:hypothetical protein